MVAYKELLDWLLYLETYSETNRYLTELNALPWYSFLRRKKKRQIINDNMILEKQLKLKYLK